MAIYLRDFAKLLIRYADDTKNLMKQLRQRSGGGSSKEETQILYHVLIKKMPGYSYAFAGLWNVLFFCFLHRCS